MRRFDAVCRLKKGLFRHLKIIHFKFQRNCVDIFAVEFDFGKTLVDACGDISRGIYPEHHKIVARFAFHKDRRENIRVILLPQSSGKSDIPDKGVGCRNPVSFTVNEISCGDFEILGGFIRGDGKEKRFTFSPGAESFQSFGITDNFGHLFIFCVAFTETVPHFDSIFAWDDHCFRLFFKLAVFIAEAGEF